MVFKTFKNDKERKAFLARYTRFRDFFRKQGGEELNITVCDAMLVWLRIHSYQDLKENGSLANARTKGLVRSEGKEYVMQDGDVVNFLFNV